MKRKHLSEYHWSNFKHRNWRKDKIKTAIVCIVFVAIIIFLFGWPYVGG